MQDPSGHPHWQKQARGRRVRQGQVNRTSYRYNNIKHVYLFIKHYLNGFNIHPGIK